MSVLLAIRLTHGLGCVTDLYGNRGVIQLSLDDERTKKTRILNDAFRRTLTGGRVVVTNGIASLSAEDRVAIIEKVRLMETFNKDNDPYGEHDFGAVEHDGQKVFFKIDYYDKDLLYGSEDPSDPSATTRVMTVMFANEY